VNDTGSVPIVVPIITPHQEPIRQPSPSIRIPVFW
jgi:hypothetical protein